MPWLDMECYERGARFHGLCSLDVFDRIKKGEVTHGGFWDFGSVFSFFSFFSFFCSFFLCALRVVGCWVVLVPLFLLLSGLSPT
jgi:hypothetical protein